MGDRDGRAERLARQGWVPKTLTPGMKVKTVIHHRLATHGRRAVHAITLPDGRNGKSERSPERQCRRACQLT